MRAARILAAVLALLGWAGLIVQYLLFVEQVGIGLASWRYIGFFTILSNTGIAAIATAIALGYEGRLTGPRARLMGVTAIVTVGFVYSLLLRFLWNPQGLQKLVDAILHDWTPILFAVLWAMMPHGELKWRDMKWALAPPAIYLAYALGRGAIDGWFPYYFLNPTIQTPTEFAVGLIGTLMMFSLIAASAIRIDQRLAMRAPFSP